ncbi:MAG: histidine utilization repressor [Acidiphilium sp.]|nr:histidine utilization repressor [Acidiphilium sp.]MDD4935558.1 histidine utilization repressor [Acidiphilium sp.]
MPNDNGRRASGKPRPLYQRVKDDIAARVAAGDWGKAGRMPSEHELTAAFGVSRMTVHRALRELSAEGIVSRIQGVGTFVAERRPRQEFLRIHDIADDITARGHCHRMRLIVLEAVRALPNQALGFNLRPGSKIFHSTVLHFEDDVPVQLEDRFISPRFAPDYLQADFTSETTARYLMRLGPATAIEHTAYAMTPGQNICELLEFGNTDDRACLVLLRRTWSNGIAATQSEFIYPGSRYSLGSQSLLDVNP